MASWKDMALYRPLHAREREDPEFDGPHEGLPLWMLPSITSWMQTIVFYREINGPARPTSQFLRNIENRMHLAPPLNDVGPRAGYADLLTRMQGDEAFGVAVVDYVLFHLDDFVSANRRHVVNELTAILREGGSAWEPTQTEEKRWVLVRRALGGTAESLEHLQSVSQHAGGHLRRAWVLLAGRHPDPSRAYDQSIKAVEAAAKPVLAPLDKDATLTKMRNALRDKPEKWSYELGTIEHVVAMMSDLAASQPDRHGSDEAREPVTAKRADALPSIWP